MTTVMSSELCQARARRRRRHARHVIAAATAVCAVLGGVAACSSGSGGGSSSSAAQTVTVFTTLSDVIPGTNKTPWEDWASAFEKANPSIHVNVITGASTTAADAMEARIVAAVRAGKTPPIDVLDSSGYIPQLEQLGDLDKVSDATIPNLAKVAPSELATYKDYAVPYRGSSVVLAYNTQYVQNPPTTLTGLLAWIKAHPGKFAYNEPSGGGSGQGFAEDVVDQYIPASMISSFVNGYNQKLESYWTKGIDQLKSLTPDLYGGSDYPKSNSDTLNDLASSSIYMGPVWSDGGNAALENGQLPKTIKFEQLKVDPFYGGPSDLAVIKGSAAESAADKLVNYMLSPGAQQIIVNGLNGYPGVELKYEPASVAKEFANIDTDWSLGFSTDFDNDFNEVWQNSVP
jgi:putative spermidine/putrescine transport system substrate-binding protein